MHTGRVLIALLLVLCGAGQAQAPQELATEAVSAMRAGRYREAEFKFARLIEQVPGVAELHSNLGLARLSLGDFQGAEASFRSALELSPDISAPKFLLGRMLFRSARYEEAARLLESAAEAHSEDASIGRLLAATWVGLQRYDAAALQYRKLLQADPHDTEALYGLGKLHLHRGQQEFDRLGEFEGSAFHLLANAEFQAERSERGRFAAVAEDFFRRAIEAEPSHPGLRSALGTFLLRRGEWEAARQMFGQALDLDSRTHEALFGRAFAKLAKGDWKGAAADIGTAARIRPEFFRPLPAPPVEELDVRVHHQLFDGRDFGSAYLRWVLTGEPAPSPTGDSEVSQTGLERMRDLVAVGRFEELARMRGVKGPEAIYLRGAAYRQLGKSMLNRLIEVSPDSARSHQILADSLYAENRFGEAAEQYLLALERHPGDPVLLLSLANARLREPDLRLATEAYRKVLAVSPLDAEASYNLGLALAAQNLHRDAVVPLRRALELQPDLSLAHAALGKSFAALGEVEEAVAHMEAAASTDEDGTLHYQLFQAYRQLGLDAKAEAARQRSIQLRP